MIAICCCVFAFASRKLIVDENDQLAKENEEVKTKVEESLKKGNGLYSQNERLEKWNME